MNRANVTRVLLDQSAKLLAVAAWRDEVADDCIDEPREASAHSNIASLLREEAAELLAAVNHVNGVSPE